MPKPANKTRPQGFPEQCQSCALNSSRKESFFFLRDQVRRGGPALGGYFDFWVGLKEQRNIGRKKYVPSNVI
jgi:hypothetical protein